jgi:hypothetical protein
MNIDVEIAKQRVKTRVVAARAEKKLASLGCAAAPELDELTAEQLERDTLSLNRVMRAWRLTGRHANGTSTIRLAGSGREVTKDWSDNKPVRLERAVMRTPKHLRPRRHQG